jgi:hypothetical protein
MSELGDIIAVEGINEYLVKVPAEAADGGGGCLDYGLGCFVKVESGGRTVVGVISGVVRTIREELLPYLSPDKQPKYLPYSEDFRDNYYKVFALGELPGEGEPVYRLARAPSVRDVVMLMDEEEVSRFHTLDGKLSASYLNRCRDRLPPEALLGILDQGEAQSRRVRVLP